jgi:hypothetical protein
MNGFLEQRKNRAIPVLFLQKLQLQ